ncbi:hypothetical protein [Methylobacterium nodulans]|uniref:Uncharacterized protein n=1 Tax=Methylobacterium nodulans (strain LMG 21967 / CNCM I-2342 / ORS 2060) TaxID=460265 RepID=B8IA03_METNO|nr:hypothetical protein [Methylobacterium nodulans]ACL57231.1 hypothetical protein Mnod_2251 [Methylobacterium nodulans ORS 2060]ACL58138.1 hypothetical protein Mnod_3212 [Methylobacterium nodulans ORS 2060]
MTQDELERLLIGLQPGQEACIHHDVYASLFPPGEPDDGARGRFYEFARRYGCTIMNDPPHDEICFRRASD